MFWAKYIRQLWCAHVSHCIVKAVVQRVKRAAVLIRGEVLGDIQRGVLVFIGIGKSDTESDMDWMIRKLLGLRIFPDEDGKMNLSVADVNGEILVVSQFTLYGDARKGTRPSFANAMLPSEAADFYSKFVCKLRNTTLLRIAEGKFAAMMDVELINDGPVTILLDSNS